MSARSPSPGVARPPIIPVRLEAKMQQVTQRPVAREKLEEKTLTIPEFNRYIWQEMLGDLPCGEATRECIRILQDKAILNVENSTSLGEINKGIRDAKSKIHNAEFGTDVSEENNSKSLSLESFMPIIQYYFSTDEPFSEVDSQGTDEEKPPGPLERILSDILNPLNFVNNFIIKGGFSLISSLFSSSNNSQDLGNTQGRQVSISDLKIKLFAMEQDVVKIEQAIRNETRSMVMELNTKVSDFQIAREITYRDAQRLEAFTIIYRFGGGSTEEYLAQSSALDRQKAETLRAWYAMENQLELLKLLVLGEAREDAISHE